MEKLRSLFKVFFIIFTIFFVLITSLYYNDKYYSQAIALSKEHPYLSKTLTILDRLYNELDILRYVQRENLPESNIIRLKFSGSDVKMINEQIELFKDVGFIKDELNTWRKAKITLNNYDQDIKFKLHGTSISPLTNFNAFSLRIKHGKGGDYLDYMREYSLLTFKDDLDISTISINKLADEFGLLAPNGRMVLTRINNVPVGMFMLVEHHEKEWFEREHQMTNYTILKSNDDWDRKENTSGTAHTSNSDNTINNKEIKTTSMRSSEALGMLNELFNAVKNNEIRRIKELIDIEYTAKFLALSALANNSHSVTGDNLKYVYDHTTGKFKFLYRIEDTIKPLTNSILDFNSSWFLSYFVPSKNLDLFKILLMDSNFRSIRDKYLMHLVIKKKEILLNANSIFDTNYQVLLNSNLSLRRESVKRKQYLEDLENNLEVIEDYLNYGKVFVTVDFNEGKKNILSIINDSYVPISLVKAYTKKSLEGNLLNKAIYMVKGNYIKAPNLNSRLEQTVKAHKLDVIANEEVINLEFMNEITKKTIPEKDVYINYVSEVSNLSDKELINILHKIEINFSLEGDTLFVKKGNYEIKEDLTFPKSKRIVLSPGVKFLISPDKSILIQSDLKAIGTESEPIIVTRLIKNQSFGVFGVIGRQKKIEVMLSNFHIDGGNESSLDGVQFLGQLSIHNANVEISDSSVSSSASDDGMNIRNSDVLITDSIFEANFADQIDLDFCNGSLNNNIFRFIVEGSNLKKDSNGDGLDVSGSKVLIQKNSFEGFLDKALSVGENSVILIKDNSFNRNLRAVTVKDGSKAYVLDNLFTNNTFNFSLYIKKRFYKEPKLYLNPTLSKSNIDNQLTDRINSVSLLPDEEIIKQYEAE